MEELVDITPDKGLMRKLGASGYTIPQALAELIDNSIDARCDDKMEVSIKLYPDKITIADRGIGMDFEQIRESVILARSHKKGKLGEFGLGMKTACLSLGKNFKVISKKKGDPIEYRVVFDSEKREQNDKWQLPVSKKEKQIDEHYTIVEVTGLTSPILTSLESKIIEDIQLRFSHFLNEIPIRVNDKVVKEVEPNIVPETVMQIEEKCEYGTIHGWAGLMEKAQEAHERYGIHCYRNRRLIKPFNKIGFTAHPSHARIYGELHMDFVPVTHNKRDFETASKEYRKVVEIMEKVMKPLVSKASIAKSKSKQTSDVKKNTDKWGKGASQAANKLIEKIRKEGEQIKLPNSDIVNVQQDSGGKLSKEAAELLKNDLEGQKKFQINFGGDTLAFTHSFENYGPSEPRLIRKYDSKKKIVRIFTNADHPVYDATKDLSFLAAIHIAWALSKFLVDISSNKNDLEKFTEIYTEMLKISSNMKNDF